MRIGDRIKLKRESKGFNKAQLGRLVGVSDASVNMWESGTIKAINHVHLLALAKVLDCTVSELVGDPQIDPLMKYVIRANEELDWMLANARWDPGTIQRIYQLREQSPNGCG